MSGFRRTEHQKLDLPESQKPDSTKNDSGLAVFRPRLTAATERRSGGAHPTFWFRPLRRDKPSIRRIRAKACFRGSI